MKIPSLTKNNREQPQRLQRLAHIEQDLRGLSSSFQCPPCHSHQTRLKHVYRSSKYQNLLLGSYAIYFIGRRSGVFLLSFRTELVGQIEAFGQQSND